MIEHDGASTWILDVDALTWRPADPRPASGYVLGSALVGGELFVVTAAHRSGEAVSSMAALDPDTGTWRQMEPVPSPISVGGVTSDGDRLIVAGTRQGSANDIIGGREPVAYHYVDGDGWQQLPNIPIDGQNSTVVWIDGVGLLAWNYDLESVLLDQSGSWTQLDDVAMLDSECHPTAVPTLAGAVALCGGIAWFDATSATWSPILGPFYTRYMVTDKAVIGLMQRGRDQTHMIEYSLPASSK